MIHLRGIDPMRGRGIDVFLRPDGRGVLRELSPGEASTEHVERRFSFELSAEARARVASAVGTLAGAKTTSQQAPGDALTRLVVKQPSGPDVAFAFVRPKEKSSAPVPAFVELIAEVARAAVKGKEPDHDGPYANAPDWTPEGF